jgi:hypothetical protein
LALLAGHGLHILGCDTFDLRTVGRFAVARIARDHSVLIEKMQILFLALSPTPRHHWNIRMGNPSGADPSYDTTKLLTPKAPD